ncbi:MAG: nitrogenase-associated protein [Chromatiales bacterium]|jgi:nitrogenase-associated protein|nr:nitrogenase-associated protein [Chromatiales bacterium]MDX9765950.1 ArsC/Spx/MgsR family protein [Ectothiorhodospiraceae bacterium]
MARVLFYEKPGCINNTRQKQLLATAGHEVIARDLLTEAWTAERLARFFDGLPVSEWFNRAAPRVISGDVRPETFTAEAALRCMLEEPLLIRRPLIESDGRRMAGFDLVRVHAWFGLAAPTVETDLETCPRNDPAHAAGGSCP